MSSTQRLYAWLLSCVPARSARVLARKIGGVQAAAPGATAPRQLLVDVSGIYREDSRTGIQRVVRALLLELLAHPPAGFAVHAVFATSKAGFRYAAPQFLESAPRQPESEMLPVAVGGGDIFLGLDLSAHLLPRHRAQLLGWKASGVAIHVVVYDLLPLRHPEWFTARSARNFKRWTRWLAVHADAAICISRSVKQELEATLRERFGLAHAALAITTISLGADIVSSAPSGGLPAFAPFLLSRLQTVPAVLMVGTLEPRKAHEQALDAFELLWRRLPNPPLLIIAGRPGWKTAALQRRLRDHPESGTRLFWLEDASDEFLACLYDCCFGVLMASHAEGFGLPLIEAALHRKPALARDIDAFREIAIDGVGYFDADTPEPLADALQEWIRLPARTPRFRHGVPTWARSARQLVDALGLAHSDEAAEALPPAVRFGSAA